MLTGFSEVQARLFARTIDKRAFEGDDQRTIRL